jgi:hypothetical protein
MSTPIVFDYASIAAGMKKRGTFNPIGEQLGREAKQAGDIEKGMDHLPSSPKNVLQWVPTPNKIYPLEISFALVVATTVDYKSKGHLPPMKDGEAINPYIRRVHFMGLIRIVDFQGQEHTPVGDGTYVLCTTSQASPSSTSAWSKKPSLVYPLRIRHEKTHSDLKSLRDNMDLPPMMPNERRDSYRKRVHKQGLIKIYNAAGTEYIPDTYGGLTRVNQP